MYRNIGINAVFFVVLFTLVNEASAQSVIQKQEKLTKQSNHEKQESNTVKVVSTESTPTKTVNKHINSMNFHFESERLGSEVINKMNFNKSHQRSLSDGILKSYRVQMKSCQSEENTKKTFDFLIGTDGFFKADFLSPGLVNIIVVPEYNSVDLKNVMLSKGMNFNFINETYFLK